jgi:serine/threonine-protein kinase
MSHATLLERLRSSEILPADKLDALANLPEARETDPRALAKVVLKRGWLTRYQINQVAAGRGKDLFVGYYLLLDRLGEGGMGRVFKAQHRHMGRIVALKLMRKEKLGSPEAVARFYQEVQAAARLTHPNIVIAYDAGQAGSVHYFSMEYVDGPDLLRLVRERGRLPVSQACEFVRQAALGLQHAHEQGLVHRDIKPGNLLVAGGASPVVKILDMGLARLGGSFENERQLTKLGQVLGTPDYLAPEQAIDARTVDIRADIYSLGCTLFFLLTGKTPFRGDTLAELLMKHQMEPPPLLREALPGAPPELQALLARMMAKKPDTRPKTPAEVAAALEPLARGAGAVPVATATPGPSSVSGDAWATLNESADGLIGRAPVGGRFDRSSDTIVGPSPGGRLRSKNRKKNHARLAIGAGIAVVVLTLIVAIGGAVLLNRPEKEPRTLNTKAKQSGRDKASEPRLLDDRSIYDVIEEVRQAEKWTKTELLGSGGMEYYNLPQPGALLIGFEVGIGKWNGQDVIHSLQGIYRYRKGRELGPVLGKKQERTVRLEAKPGYAVGKATLRAGRGIDAIQLTFMAIDGQKLNPIDSYDSDWVGGKGGNVRSIGGDGTPVIGVYARMQEIDGVTNGLGLILARSAR